MVREDDGDFTYSLSFESNRDQLLQQHSTPHYLEDEPHKNGSFLDTKSIHFRGRYINLRFLEDHSIWRSITIPTRDHRHTLYFQFLFFLPFLPALPVTKHKLDIQGTSKICEQSHRTPQNLNPATHPYLFHRQL